MGYSAEVVQRARARLAQAKEDRESENRQHLAEAYAKVPRIREIDMLLRRTMAQAAQAAFLQGSDGQALLEQARQENLGLQRERAALAAANFEEGFLDDSPICDKCGGKLYTRDDDKPETVKKRLDVFRSTTLPLVDFYSKKGLIVPIPPELSKAGAIADMTDLCKELGLLK